MILNWFNLVGQFGNTKQGKSMTKVVVLFVALFGILGCATMFGDKERTVMVESTPPGAKVLLNGLPYGKTPTTIQITNMLSSNSITLKLDGYDEITRNVSTSIQPVAFLNLINIVCWGVDLATGNVMKIDTRVISVDLDKKTVTLKGDLGERTVGLGEFNRCSKS